MKTKKKKPEDKKTKGVVVEIPEEFNRSLKLMVISLDELGVKTNKSALIVKLAQIGFNTEKNHGN